MPDERDAHLTVVDWAGLLLALKAECEAQHARAEAAEARLGKLLAIACTCRAIETCDRCVAIEGDLYR